MSVRVSGSWIRRQMFDALDAAIHFGINHTYKHRDDDIPDDIRESLVEQIGREIELVLDEILTFESELEDIP